MMETESIKSEPTDSEKSWEKVGDGEEGAEPSPPPVQALSYPLSSPDGVFQLHVGSPVKLPPQVVGAADITFAVTPKLPPGFVLNETTGVITGVPNGISEDQVQTFTVTAMVKGVAVLSTTLNLAVAPGKIHTVVGNRAGGHTQSKDLPALQQKLQSPRSLLVHRGKLYVGQDVSIAEMDLKTGKLRLLLGWPGNGGNEGDGKQKEKCKVGSINGLAVHKEFLYFSDWTHHVVRRVGLPLSATPGLVSLVCGTGKRGWSGDEGPAAWAQLYNPWGLAIVSEKLLLIADSGNHCIRAVQLNESGTFSGDSVIENVLCPEVTLQRPHGLLAVGRVAYVADTENDRILSMRFEKTEHAKPEIATFAGGGKKFVDGAPAVTWQLPHPTGLCLGADGKQMYVTCRKWTDIMLRISLDEEQHSTCQVAGTGVASQGADFVSATAAPLSNPTAVAAVGEGHIVISEDHCVRLLPVSGAPLGLTTSACTLAKLADKAGFLGAWRTLKSDGTIASPFCLPAGKAYVSPALPPQNVHFELILNGLDLPRAVVLGLATKASIQRLAANLQQDGTLNDNDFLGTALMMVPLPGESRQSKILQYVAGMVPAAAQGEAAAAGGSPVKQVFLRDRIALTGSIGHAANAEDGSCTYSLQDVKLNGFAAAFNSSSTPPVGGDVPMHTFVAAWGATSQLQIFSESPPHMERCSE